MIDNQTKRFWIGLARAVAGALLFSLPMMLTMEMWSIGPTSSPLQMGALLSMTFPILFGLAKLSGFEEPEGWAGTAVDAFVAYAVGWLTTFMILSVFAVLNVATMPLSELIGVISIQTIPASIGAVLAASQLGGHTDSDDEIQTNDDDGAHTTREYFRELFVMAIGALFLAFNVAPTEEMVLVAFKMTAWHGCLVMLLSLMIMHGFVFKVKFHGQKPIPQEQSAWSVFLRFTIPGYAIALLVSLFCLWSFGSTANTAIDEVVMATTVLGLPAAVGASSARLIL
ncbi:TIGR02587 family membrane protein [Allorhodopirellula solitaria]|uniref:TIGR02587 family membrane protein n=1 Tax=Allorhodopirellula solitaria TaxID=2527987 RepID=A0A5C5X2N1_9BACT|nr:TIGR02587 family membrane protein [Allorhodopirellula solitaria]TWT56492.1 hypothetical protein CA85_40230 [Allorhodopirellula solitaria]